MIPLTLLPNIITTITKIASSIGPMIAKYAPVVIETVGKNLPKVIKTVEAISQVVAVLQPNEQVETLGAKAMVAEKKPEDFDQINDYIEYLQKEIEIDSRELSSDAVDVIARQAIGASIAIKGVGHALDVDISIPFLNAISHFDINPNVIIALSKSYEASGLNADDVQKYLDDSMSIEEIQQHSNVFIDAYQAANPEMNIEDAEDAVMALR